MALRAIRLPDDPEQWTTRSVMLVGAFAFTIGVLFAFYFPTCVQHVKAFREISSD